jgi:hypothetical protein
MVWLGRPKFFGVGNLGRDGAPLDLSLEKRAPLLTSGWEDGVCGAAGEEGLCPPPPPPPPPPPLCRKRCIVSFPAEGSFLALDLLSCLHQRKEACWLQTTVNHGAKEGGLEVL